MKRMKHYVFSLLLSFLVLPGFTQDWYAMTEGDDVNYYEVVEAGEKYFANRDKGKGSGYKLFQRWKYFAHRLVDDKGHLPSPSEMLDAKREFDNTYNQKSNKASFTGDWKELGPFSWTRTTGWNPGVGRIVAIAVEATQQNLIFAGSPGGGIWRTRDAGRNWVPLGDRLSNVNIYGIGIDPFDQNVVYALNSAGRILKSTNQGDSWTEIFNTGSSVNRSRLFAFHPTRQGEFLVASTAGVYKTTNNGGSFSRVLTASVEDVMYKPGDPNTVYACGTRFYKSTNSGNSFTQRTTGITSTSRLRMTVTPADPNLVYMVQANGGSFGRFYRSTNSGESFTVRAAQNPPYFTQANRDMALMASWTNPNEVHVAGMDNHRTRDGGNSFSRLAAWSAPTDPSYIHADVEVMVCVNDVFYAGTDGGVYRSTNNGDSYQDLSSLGGLAVHQFYRIHGTPQDHDMYVGGSQDNGTNITRNRNPEWSAWLGADGMECFIDYSNPNIIYGTTQNGSLSRTTNGGGGRTSISPAGVGSGNWVTPFDIDPEVPSTIYSGYNGMYKSTDRGSSWRNISAGINTGGNLDEIAIAPSDNNYMYMANNSNMWRTTNGQATNPTWTSINSFSGNVNYISVDPNNPQRVAIACSGSRVYVSTNGGTTWTNKSMNLPGAGANCVIWDDASNNGLYVGSQNSVYYTNDALNEWLPFASGLPQVQVNEFYIHYNEKTITCGTYGRGAWQSPLFGSALIPSISATGDFIFCEGDDVELEVTVESQTPGNLTYQWKRDGQDINGATSSSYMASATGEYTVFASNGDESGLSDPFRVTVVSNPTAPTVAVTPSCGPGEVSLEAVNDSGEINWYSSANDATSDFTGDNYVLNLSNTSTIYVEARTKGITGNVGPENNTFGGGDNHAGGFYLVFDAEKPFRLKSAKVYATGTKTRVLELRNSSNVLIESQDIAIQDGESVIDIDMIIPAGNDYSIGFASGADLFRSNENVSFPYELDDLVSIKASTATDPGAFYYYLYNWEVEEIFPECIGERQAVEAKVVGKPDAPLGADVVACNGDPGPFVLTAAASENGELRWFDAENAGNLVETGENLSIQNANDDESYFVEEVITESQTVFGGPTDNSFGDGGEHAGGFYLTFNASQDFTLVSAKVYAFGAGNRTIELRDANETVLASKVINIPDGESTIDIDIDVSAGTGLQIGFASGAQLFRSNSGVSFPYTVSDEVTITGSTAGEDFYYYLYNWEVTTDGFECASERSEVFLTFDVCTGVNEPNNLLGSLSVYPNPASEVVNIEVLDNSKIASLRLFDALGQVVYEKDQMSSAISVSNLKPGNYALIITAEDGKTGVYNLIVN